MNNSNNEIWVFLSHSNKDYEKVRQVRNMLEEENLRPLMFFLHCLNDDDEIDDLIKREIDCRTRFILCDSKNARCSKWVQKEVNYIRSQDRIYETIDLDQPIAEIKKKLAEFKRQATLFISYNRENQKLAQSVYRRLSKYDFHVFVDMDSLCPGDDYLKTVISSLDRAASNGHIIAIMNQRVLSQGSGSRHEIKRAIAYDKENGVQSILPFATNHELISTISKDQELSSLNAYSILDVSDKSIDEQCDEIVNTVLTKMLTPGAILTHAHNFKNGMNGKTDEEEAEKLYSLYFKLADQATDNGSDTAWRALGRCYEMGWGTSINLYHALDCYRDSIGCKEDAERVSFKIRAGKEDTIRSNDETIIQKVAHTISNFFK